MTQTYMSHRTKIIIGIAAVIVLVLLLIERYVSDSINNFYFPEQRHAASNTSNAVGQEEQTSKPEYDFVEQYRTDSKIFSCYVRLYTESGCALYVSDIAGENLRDTGVGVDYGDFEKKILPSPDGTRLLLVQEDKAILLDASTLDQKVVFQAPAGEALGTYDGFPSFIPYVKWIDNDTIQISLFKQDTQESFGSEAPAAPLEVKTIRVQ